MAEKQSQSAIMVIGDQNKSLVWQLEQPKVGKFTNTFPYDHAEFARSESTEHPHSSDFIAEALHLLLEDAEIEAPYVLVGYATGETYIKAFSRRYPKEVAAMIFIDEPSLNVPNVGACKQNHAISCLPIRREVRLKSPVRAAA